MSSPPTIRGLEQLDAQVTDAIRQFWAVKLAQEQKQIDKSGSDRDRGARSAVTGGHHVDALLAVIADVLSQNGVPEASIHMRRKLELPGYFRVEKKWDLIALHEDKLLGCVEFKSQGSSFGNNYNNRMEEAIGLGHDTHVAYREGVFGHSASPWTGYLMLMPDADAARSPVRVKEPHYPVYPEYKNASYIKRYEESLTRLVRERLYSACALILASPDKTGNWTEPSEELSIRRFIASFAAHCIGAMA